MKSEKKATVIFALSLDNESPKNKELLNLHNLEETHEIEYINYWSVLDSLFP